MPTHCVNASVNVQGHKTAAFTSILSDNSLMQRISRMCIYIRASIRATANCTKLATMSTLKEICLPKALKHLNDSKVVWWKNDTIYQTILDTRRQIGLQPIQSEAAKEYVRYRIYRMEVESRKKPFQVD